MTDIGIVLGPKNILDVVKIVIPGVVIRREYTVIKIDANLNNKECYLLVQWNVHTESTR